MHTFTKKLVPTNNYGKKECTEDVLLAFPPSLGYYPLKGTRAWGRKVVTTHPRGCKARKGGNRGDENGKSPTCMPVTYNDERRKATKSTGGKS